MSRQLPPTAAPDPGNTLGEVLLALGGRLTRLQTEILASLERRRVEATRDSIGFGEAPAEVVRPERPGMPLGLPPLSDEDIAMVRRWLEG